MQAVNLISKSSRILFTRGCAPQYARNTPQVWVFKPSPTWDIISKNYGTSSDPRFSTLYGAVKRGDKTVVRAELEKGGININGVDEENRTTLLAAAVLANNFEITKMLIVNDADINAWVKEDGNTLLHIATKNGDEQIATMLIQYGIKLNLLNKAKATPLIIGISSGRSGIVKALLKEGVSVASVGDSEYPLNTAARTGQTAIARDLVAHSATYKDATAHLTDNSTPIHLAAENGHANIIQYLSTLPHASITAERASDGATPLHLAAGNGHLAAVRVLCELGASAFTKDKKGRTPIDYARGKGHKNVEEFFASLSSNPHIPKK